jgi:hypothetical protein
LSAAPLRSVGLMVASSGVLTVNDAMVKWLAQSYPVGQVITVRGLFVFVIAVGWVLARGRAGDLRVTRWRLQLARGALMSASTFLFVTALSLMPIADAIAIAFAGPVIATALAAMLLREPVGWQRWSAIGVGFAGVVIMVRPTPELIRLAALVPLAAALVGAFRDVVTRRMGTGGESTVAILVVSTAVVTLAGLSARRRPVRRERTSRGPGARAHDRVVQARRGRPRRPFQVHEPAVGGGPGIRRLGGSAGALDVDRSGAAGRQRAVHLAPRALAEPGAVAGGWQFGDTRACKRGLSRAVARVRRLYSTDAGAIRSSPRGASSPAPPARETRRRPRTGAVV